MKVIEKIEIEYVIPETIEEEEEIKKILKDAALEKDSKRKLKDYTLHKKINRNSMGFWMQSN